MKIQVLKWNGEMLKWEIKVPMQAPVTLQNDLDDKRSIKTHLCHFHLCKC